MPLTDAVSVNRGIGPICSNKYYTAPEQEAKDYALAGQHLLASKFPAFKDLGERMLVAGDVFEETQDATQADEVKGEFNSRTLANKILVLIATYRDSEAVYHLVEALKALGYTKLNEAIAKRIGKRKVKTTKKVPAKTVTVDHRDGYLRVITPFNETFNEWRRTHGRWDGSAHLIPNEHKVSLWAVLRTLYPGANLRVDGEFKQVIK
jgi:hypothetical protein